MSQAVQTKRKTLSGPYGEADLEGDRFGQEEDHCSYPPEGAPLESDISELKAALGAKMAEFSDHSDVYTLMVPPDGDPDAHLPGSIEEAIRQVLEQVPRSKSPPELPPEAYPRSGSTPPPALTDDGDDDAPTP